ncbi:MAG TPA: C40 family peptidase, partial [Gaiellaceae bacterium]|nr:C40 family peptidase [Gaiellaceae bacterium]
AAPAPEPAAPAPEPAPAAEATPDAAPQPAADDAPDALDASSAPTRAGYEPQPEAPAAPAAPAPKRAAQQHAHAKRAKTHAPQRATRHVESRPVFAPVQPFVPAVPFDVEAWEHANPGSSVGATAVAVAEHFIGTPYVWGGSTPTGGFDCSGLMLYVYGQLGISMPHYAASQFALFPHLRPSQLRPGDLVFFEPKVDGPGHVAMYAGGDTIIEAPHTGALVRYGSLLRSASALGFLGAVRPYTPEGHSRRVIAKHHAARAHSSVGPAGMALAW